MTQGDSLPQSFIQGHQNTKPAKNIEQPKGLENEGKVQGLGKGVEYQKLVAIKLGDKLIYKDKQYTVVMKKGSYITMADDNQHLQVAHFTDTVQSNDVYADIWNRMQVEARNNLLHKTKVPIEFGTRSWYELPKVLKAFLNRSDVWAEIKKPATVFTPVQVSGNAGREPGITRDDESRSHRDLTDPVNAKQYEGKKDKSDVEHGATGGVVTDTPFDAPEDYEEDKREGKRAQQRHEHLDKPRNPKDDGYEVTIGYHTKEDGVHLIDSNGDKWYDEKKFHEEEEKANMAAITGKPSNPPKEDTDKAVQNMAGITGKPSHPTKEKEGDGGTVTTSTEGVNNPVNITGKPSQIKKNGISSNVKKSSRYGVRYDVSQEEFDESQQ